MIKISNLHKSFGENKVINGIDLKVSDGEILAIIGFSGCGKSTLLRIIAGLESYDQGELELSKAQIGMSFQYSALFDSLSVEENVGFPLKIKKIVTDKDKLSKIVSEKLSLVGLAGIEKLYPNELSGGMKKRVSFAGAIINNPKLILYDEPTAGLDPVASTIIEDLIIKLSKDLHATSIVVTHQQTTIIRTATRVALMYGGKIPWQGSPEELFDPSYSNPFAKQFREGSPNGPMEVNV